MTVCAGDEELSQHSRVLNTDVFDIVIGTDFLGRNAQVELLSLERTYALHCNFSIGPSLTLWSCQDEKTPV